LLATLLSRLLPMKPPQHDRAGITLLEVLISIGILSVGLASVMALIPAGGNQAKKAIIEDRRGAMGVAGFADLVNYGMLNTSNWSTVPTAPYRIVIDPLGNAAFPAAATGLTAITVGGVSAGSAAAGVVFAAGDDLVYADDPTVSDPENFPQVARLTSGNERRLADGYFSWLVALVPAGTASPTQFYRATIVEFYKRSASTSVIARYTGATRNSVTTFTYSWSGTQPTIEEFRSLFPVGGVLLFTDNSAIHEWRRILVAAPTIAGSNVTSVELLVDRDVTAGANEIIAFEGAVGMIEKTVQLEDPSPWTP
jgi:hypothetical protein